nr:unnamed protein product [Callosobruchus chinensis]
MFLNWGTDRQHGVTTTTTTDCIPVIQDRLPPSTAFNASGHQRRWTLSVATPVYPKASPSVLQHLVRRYRTDPTRIRTVTTFIHLFFVLN